MSEFDGHEDSSSTHQSVSCSNFVLAVAHEEMNSRRRNTMEDCHRILAHISPSLPQYSLLAIYDGHGGRQIVDFLETGLEQQLAEELAMEDDASIEEKLTRAFLITDFKSKELKITTSGATAVVALIRDSPEGKDLYVANVGDSRAVLVSRSPIEGQDPGLDGFFARRLSYDHRADDMQEQKRIVEAGGFVTRNRVLGILAVSRSFGDHGMKDFVIGRVEHICANCILHLCFNAYYCTLAQPHIASARLSTENNPVMVILACDGVWDVLSDQEAADLLLARYQVDGPFEDAAKLLVNIYSICNHFCFNFFAFCSSIGGRSN
jgi:serine/threonine protein phosphatase PrpC